jgi:hypothetical protein
LELKHIELIKQKIYEIVANKTTYSAEQLKNFNYIAEEIWKWIDNMKKEIKKFE